MPPEDPDDITRLPCVVQNHDWLEAFRAQIRYRANKDLIKLHTKSDQNGNSHVGFEQLLLSGVEDVIYRNTLPKVRPVAAINAEISAVESNILTVKHCMQDLEVDRDLPLDWDNIPPGVEVKRKSYVALWDQLASYKGTRRYLLLQRTVSNTDREAKRDTFSVARLRTIVKVATGRPHDTEICRLLNVGSYAAGFKRDDWDVGTLQKTAARFKTEYRREERITFQLAVAHILYQLDRKHEIHWYTDIWQSPFHYIDIFPGCAGTCHP
jgi:hypothetical protein